MKLALLALLLAIGFVFWVGGVQVDSQSIRVACKYKFFKDDYLWCTEPLRQGLNKDKQKCIISAACKKQEPIYEFTTFVTNSTKECQNITKCMLKGGAKICHRNKPCDENQDSADCEQVPEKIEQGDCLRKKHRSSVVSASADIGSDWDDEGWAGEDY